MIPSSRHPSLPEDPPEVQAIRDLFAGSVEFRNAVLASPVLGPTGATIIEVHRDQQIAFRVEAPTAAEGYALLHELITPLVHPRHQMQRSMASLPG